jgi:hypothetical protein
LVELYVSCVERCNQGRFAPGELGQTDRRQLLEDAADILSRLERQGV